MSDEENIAVDLTDKFKRVWDRGVLGAGIVVGVLDTGTGEKIRAFAATIAANGRPDIPFGRIETVDDEFGAPGPGWDGGEHAYEIMRRIVYFAPAVLVLDLPVFRPVPTPPLLQRAMDAAVARDADILNLSLGQKVLHRDIEKHLGECVVCSHAERLVTRQDTLLVAAIGNYGRDGEAMACPAVAPSVLSVGAVTSPEEQAWYRLHPGKRLEDFLEGRASTSYAAALQSGVFALLRSAFPGIQAGALKLMLNASHGLAPAASEHEPLDIFDYVLRIAGGDYVNSVEWRGLRSALGITTRRQLLRTPVPAGAGELADVWAVVATQRERGDRFALAIDAFWRGRHEGQDHDTLSAAIDHYRAAADGMASLQLADMAAASLLYLGTALCFRAKLPGNIINTRDVGEAFKALTDALTQIDGSQHPGKEALRGSALSWRARVLTLSADFHPGANDRAIEEAQAAVTILGGLPATGTVTKDLAHAHLHLARAFFYQAKSRRWGRGRNFARAREHAGKAVALGGATDAYTRTEGEWLVANSR